MYFETESLQNNIGEDLDRRNRNFEKIETDTTLMATNLVTNGDFSNGTTGWSSGAVTNTLSVVDGALRTTAGDKPYVGQVLQTKIPANVKLYILFKARANRVANANIGLSTDPTFSVIIQYSNVALTTNFTNYSLILTPTSNVVGVRINGVDYTNVGDYIDIDNFEIIDLTATFGKGNEPTVEQMDEIMSKFPNSWFDGTKNLFRASETLKKQIALDSLTEFDAKNLVVNGDFSNGTTGWNPNNATISATNKIITVTATGAIAYSDIYQPTIASNYQANNKIYASLKMKVSNSECSSIALRGAIGGGGTVAIAEKTFPIGNQQYMLSGITSLTSSGQLIVFIRQLYPDSTIAAGKTMEVQNVQLIDLTATFGAGKEPTLAEMDRLMARYPNSWFDGVKPIQTIETLYQEKANKVQEAWITPTLLNGWTGSIGYAKNDTGMVNIYFDLIVGTGTAFTSILSLPITYAPKRNMVVRAMNNSSGTAHDFRMYSSGGFHNLTALTTGHNLSGVVSYFAG